MRFKALKFLVVVGLAGMLIPSAAYGVADGVLKLVPNGTYGWYQSGSGGEFTFQEYSTPEGNNFDANMAYYIAGTPGTPGTSTTPGTPGTGTKSVADPASYPNNFQTFCVEGAEYIQNGSVSGGYKGPYSAVLADQTRKTNTKLTKGSAYLYFMFARGLLVASDTLVNDAGAVYDYAGGEGAREADANELQRAIWYFMGPDVGVGEETGAGQPANPTEDGPNPFKTLVLKVFNDEIAARQANFASGDRAYDVQVLNLWTEGHEGENGYQRQDQLILIGDGYGPPPVPDGGLTVALLGMALTGLASVGRRLRK